MNNLLIQAALNAVIKIIIGQDVFKRIQHQVIIWADKEIEGAEKRQGVLNALEVISLKASKSVINLGIEIAVLKLNTLNK